MQTTAWLLLTRCLTVKQEREKGGGGGEGEEERERERGREEMGINKRLGHRKWLAVTPDVGFFTVAGLGSTWSGRQSSHTAPPRPTLGSGSLTVLVSSTWGPPLSTSRTEAGSWKVTKPNPLRKRERQKTVSA